MNAMEKPVLLTDAECEAVFGGALLLPSDQVIFSGFDNAAPQPLHPALYNGGQEGPWHATSGEPFSKNPSGAIGFVV